MSRFALAAAFLMALGHQAQAQAAPPAPAQAPAQAPEQAPEQAPGQAPPGYTQMILGLGYTTEDPAFAVGFEHKPARSRIAFRTLVEYREKMWGSPDMTNPAFSSRRLLGVQFLGARIFRDGRRIQPYLLGGLGVYHEDAQWGGYPLVFTDSGIVQGPFTYRATERLIPALITGTGVNARLGSVTLFGELRLPLYRTGMRNFSYGPQVPLMFGIRF